MRSFPTSFRQILLSALATVLAAGLPLSAVVTPQEDSRELTKRLGLIETTVREGIRKKELPGAVVLIGHRGKVVYRRAFGHRSLRPSRLPMRVDTIFDLASLTKVVATTSSIMKLFEEGRIALNDRVRDYFPEFSAEGKGGVTIRDLLTHYSGLRPDLDLDVPWSGYKTGIRLVAAEKLVAAPRTRFIYSDINFEALGEIVGRISGKPLDVYAREKIFLPLGMKNTRFRPPSKLRRRIAATQYERGRRGKMLWGVVHDPTARRMGGLAGHAGLFSTADDLSIFAQMILNGGTYEGVRMFSPLSVHKMTTPQSPPGKRLRRGLGWDIDTTFTRNRGELFPVGSFGHTGYTGTSLWIDPSSETYVIFLSNRVHPDGTGDVGSLRGRVATLVAAALGGDWATEVGAASGGTSGLPQLTSIHEIRPRQDRFGSNPVRVKLGVDVLENQQFRPIRGKRVGLVTNHTGLNSAGRRNIDVLMESSEVTLAALFSPEHGLAGVASAGRRVASSQHASTGLPIYSLYGETRRPTPEMLEGLDALVYDIQDVGARFYTYITTLGYVMEAAAERNIPVYVLDRPNPLGGLLVEGPRLEESLLSFVGYFPLPVRHGMTVGELARLFNAENKIGCDLKVIPMEGWRRTLWFDQTGLRWVNPSPNIRNLPQAVLYPGVALLEGANVSVGRGTDTPFQLFGAPWMNDTALAAHLNSRRIPGVNFIPIRFTPHSGRYRNEECQGVSVVLLDREELNSPQMGVELLAALQELYPEQFELDRTLRLVGSDAVIEGVKEGRDPRLLQIEWQEELDRFRKLREPYLLYR